MYKVTLEIDNILQTVPVMLDALIAKLWLIDKHPELHIQKPAYEKGELVDFSQFADFPIEFDKEVGIFKASYIFLNGNINAFVTSEKKRWNEREQWRIDTKKSKAIDTQRGDYKSANIPRVGFTCSNATAFFEGDAKEVLRLLQNCIGVGKKVVKSYGWIKSVKIEEVEACFYDELLRPIPMDFATKMKLSGQVLNIRLMPPYHQFVDSKLCVAPIIKMD